MTEIEIAQVPSQRRPGRFVWAARCVICRVWIPLAADDRAGVERILGDNLPVHAECKDKPSTTTPTMDGINL